MSIEVYPVGAVLGGKASADGAHVDLLCAWGNGERFMLRLSFELTSAMQIVLQDAAADAARQGGRKVAPPIAEGLLLQASRIPGQDTLTVRLDGGMQLQLLVPAGRYDAGVPRAPDAGPEQGGRDGAA